MQSRLLVVLGVLWMLLSTVVLGYELGRPPEIIVHWVTETEIDTAGFNLYRSDSADGPFVRLNDTLIYGEGAPLTGSEYDFIDSDVGREHNYVYRLEEVEVDGQVNELDLIRASVQPVQTLVVILAVAGLLIGGYLLISGMFSRRISAASGSPSQEKLVRGRAIEREGE